MKKPYLIAAMFALSASLSSMSMDAEAAGKQRTPRGELVHQIVMKWGGHVQEAYRADVREWSANMVPLFSKASLDTLRRAANARSFDAMNNAFIDNGEQIGTQQNALATDSGRIRSSKLGDIADDLVFVPVSPCRIVDTRLAGGAIAANTVRSFDVTAVSDYTFQGGDASNCNGAGAAGSFAAAALNLTIAAPFSNGYITAFPFLGTQPLASNLNYVAGQTVANFAVVKLDQGASANELSVYSFAQTHLIIDIVGYYINPEATQLDCVEVTSSGVDIAAGGSGSQSTAVCPAGYEITGGGCSSSTFDGKIVTSRSFDSSPTSQSHFCAFRNQGTGPANFVAFGRCCRTPGRP